MRLSGLIPSLATTTFVTVSVLAVGVIIGAGGGSRLAQSD